MDLDKLEELYVMKDKGLLSEEEFRRLQNELLNPVPGAAPAAVPDGGTVSDCSAAGLFKGSFLAFLSAFGRWHDVGGRTSRFDYWGFSFASLVISFVYGLAKPFIKDFFGAGHSLLSLAFALLSLLFSLALFWVSLTVLIRRFHDIGRRGWWMFLIIPLLLFPFYKGDKTANRFGPAVETNEKRAVRLIWTVMIPEILCLFLFAAVFFIGMASGYSNAMHRFRLTKTTDQILSISGNIRTLFAGRPDYGDAENANMMKTLGVVGEDLCRDPHCSALVNAYGGDIHIKARRNGGFSLYYNDLPKDACVALTVFGWNAALKDFEGLVVNPEKGISEANRFVAPPSPAEAKAVCSSEKNSIIWLMR